jgi:hypothetical protein
MFSPYRLSGTSPARGCQKGTPLTIDTPHLAVLRYVVGTALYSGSEIHPVTRVVPSVAVGTTSASDIVSQLVDKCEVPVSTTILDFIDTQRADRAGFAVAQPPVDDPFHCIEDLLPTGSEAERRFFPG